MNEWFEIVETPIEAESVIKKVEYSAAGVITTFIGTIREWTKGKANSLSRISSIRSNGSKNAC